jgi:hypothetical protein
MSRTRPSQSPRWLPDVTVPWLWVVDPKPFRGRTRRDDERHVEHRFTVTTVAHKRWSVVTFKEPLARLEDALLTVRLIDSRGPGADRGQTDTGVMVPAGRASRFEDDPHNRKVRRASLAFDLDVLVLLLELPERCSH